MQQILCQQLSLHDHYYYYYYYYLQEDHSSWVISKTGNTQEPPKINLSNSVKGTQDLTLKGKGLEVNIIFQKVPFWHFPYTQMYTSL